MSERVDVKQNFTPVELSQLLTKVKDLKDEGYRFAQACATVVDDKFEILYSCLLYTSTGFIRNDISVFVKIRYIGK